MQSAPDQFRWIEVFFWGHGRRETQIDDTVKAFFERQKIAHSIDQIKIKTDPVQRDMLLKLLAEEKAKPDQSLNSIRPATGVRRPH